VRYVGHPSVDKVRPRYGKVEALRHFQLDGQKPVIGLLPGSRGHEVERLLPVMLAAARKIKEKLPAAQFILPQAQSISESLLSRYLDTTDITIRIIKNQPYEAIECCDAVMTKSGTATLEIALLQVPMVIVYKLAEPTYWLGRWLVKTPFIGLPNIIAGKSIVKELIQHDASALKIAEEIITILTDPDYQNRMQSALAEVKERLGTGEGSKNMAKLALEML